MALEVARVAKQMVRGVPYLKKELGRRLSIATGIPFSTPQAYYVVFSGKCNLACKFCTIYHHTEPMLTRDQMIRIVREAKELSGSGFNISLSGGEPTIFKPLYETLETAQKLGVNFGFTSNGLAFTKQNVERIISYDPFNINISLESVDPAVNEWLRPLENGTQRTLEGIENLAAEKQRTGARVSLIVKPTIMEQNYRGLPALVRHFGKNSPVQVHFQPYVGFKDQPFWIKDLANLRAVFDELIAMRAEGFRIVGDAATFQGFYEYLADPPQVDGMRPLDLDGHKRNCDIGLRAMSIFQTGDVWFCDFLKKPVGNINQNSLSEIFRGEMARRQRQTMVNCNIDCQQTCKRPIPLHVKARSFLRMG